VERIENTLYAKRYPLYAKKELLMYEKFYGFKENPFRMTPDSKFFYPSPKHTEALSSLLYTIQQRKGFVVITGEIGAGKTTVCQTLLRKLDLNTKVARVFNTHLTNRELLIAILDDLEIPYKPGTKGKLIGQLYDFLITQAFSGVNVVILIDEAQNLSPTVLEEVRMLSNLETEKEKLIQIVLVGQPQLKEKLKMPKLEQLRQRVVLHYHIAPLTVQETKDYVRHRLAVAGGDSEIFEEEALDRVYAFSKGVPRLTNLICDSALLSGFLYERKTISREIMDEVIREAPLQGSSAEDPSFVEKIAHSV